MRVSVFGLGYVGCVSAACLAREGHEVFGVDVNRDKVDAINRGDPTIVETGIAELVSEVVASGRLRATDEVEEAIAGSELSLVCVGTPSLPNGGLDLTFITRVCEQIGEEIGYKDEPHTVVIRSTVLPGTLEGCVIPTLADASDTPLGDLFHASVNPEFLREGTSIADFYDPPFTLIGATSDHAAEKVASLYEGLDAPTHRLEIAEAELVKYACNAFHALKVSFANEIGNLASALGIDSHSVMNAFCTDDKLNLSRAYLRPGFAFGGSCLPKDVRALVHAARQHDVATPVLDGALETNRLQVERAVDLVLETGARRVAMLGLSFKEGTDDLRESPMVALAERLIGKGIDLRIFDSEVRQAALMGANREFIEGQIPHIWSLVGADLAEVVEGAEALVLGNRSEEFLAVETLRSAGQTVIDLVRVLPDRISGDWYRGICW